MNANASLLSLLTISEQTREHIFFAYLKELNELAPSTIYWYPDKGRHGQAKDLWKQRNVKQWLLVGPDKEVRDIWETMLVEGKYTQTWPNKVDKAFSILPAKRQELSDDHRLVDGLPPLMYSDLPYTYRLDHFDPAISFLIDEKNNCNFIEGYAYHHLVDPLYPHGLLPQNGLYEYLKNSVNAVNVKRDIYYTMREHGAPDRAMERLLIGFIQAQATFRCEHSIEIRSHDGKRIVGASMIDSTTGKWEVPLDHDEGMGQILLINQKIKAPTNGEKYVILKAITINHYVGHTIITDLFKRQITLFDGEKQEVFSTVQSISWDAALAPDSKQSAIELSDKITSVLLSIGTHIMISDPFLIGDFYEAADTGKITFESMSQLIFVNALLTAIGKGGVQSLKLLGDWSKAKKFIKGEKEEALRKYTLLSKLIRQTYETSHRLKLTTLELALANEKFHDRYWMSDLPSKDATYLVSNSTNGPFESNELKIIKQNTLESAKEKAKFARRYSDAEKFNLLV